MNINLTANESVVLFEFLYRITKNEKSEKILDTIIEDESEKTVLCNILCDLEKNLVEPCYPNYKEILKTARESIKKSYYC